MSLAYYPFYPADYQADTSHLTLLEDGAYNRLLRLCWLTPGCSIPADHEWIYRRASARTDDEKAAIDTVLKEFFVVRAGRYHSPRLTREHDKASATQKSAILNGSKGGRAKALKMAGNSLAEAKRPLSEGLANQNQNQNQNQESKTDTTGAASNTEAAREAAAPVDLVCQALGVRLLDDPRRIVWPSQLAALLAQGYDMTRDLLPAAQACRARGKVPTALTYLRAIADEQRSGAKGKPAPVKKFRRSDWIARLDLIAKAKAEGRPEPSSPNWPPMSECPEDLRADGVKSSTGLAVAGKTGPPATPHAADPPRPALAHPVAFNNHMRVSNG